MTAVRRRSKQSGAGKVLYFSTIGAQARQTTLLSQHTIGEFIFGQLEIPVTYLRPAWFIENTAWDTVSARDNGVCARHKSPRRPPER
jgi:NAD(P)H dehydrogenase (quinone)